MSETRTTTTDRSVLPSGTDAAVHYATSALIVAQRNGRDPVEQTHAVIVEFLRVLRRTENAIGARSIATYLTGIR